MQTSLHISDVAIASNARRHWVDVNALAGTIRQRLCSASCEVYRAPPTSCSNVQRALLYSRMASTLEPDERRAIVSVVYAVACVVLLAGIAPLHMVLGYAYELGTQQYSTWGRDAALPLAALASAWAVVLASARRTRSWWTIGAILISVAVLAFWDSRQPWKLRRLQKIGSVESSQESLFYDSKLAMTSATVAFLWLSGIALMFADKSNRGSAPKSQPAAAEH
jgi:hypothetical protein